MIVNNIAVFALKRKLYRLVRIIDRIQEDVFLVEHQTYRTLDQLTSIVLFPIRKAYVGRYVPQRRLMNRVTKVVAYRQHSIVAAQRQ